MGISLHTPGDWWSRNNNNNKKALKKETLNVRRIPFNLFALAFHLSLPILISCSRPPSVACRWKPRPLVWHQGCRQLALSLKASECPTSSALNSISHFRSATKSPEIQSSCLFYAIPNNLLASYLRSHHVDSIWWGNVYVFVYYTQGRFKRVPADECTVWSPCGLLNGSHLWKLYEFCAADK